MADLILWTDDGDGPLLGRAGTLAHPLFAITGRPRQWVLLESWLPPWSASRAPVATSDDVGPEALKARAEELLREFASSIGAVFPAAPELLRFDGTRCDWEVKALDGEYDQCPAKSRYRVERSDHDPGVSRPPEYGPAEACEAHLSDTVCALVDGDDRLTAVVRVRWT